MPRISVIGAGPAGSYSAYLLAKAGFAVDVFEEHSAVGLPVHCTGIVTSELLKFVHGEFVINRIRSARIFAPDGSFVELKLKRPNLILDRAAFDRHIAQMA